MLMASLPPALLKGSDVAATHSRFNSRISQRF